MSEWKGCSNCMHNNLGHYAYPCNACLKANGHISHAMWEPCIANEGKEVERRCSTCKHMDTACDCTEQVGKDHPDWEPKHKFKIGDKVRVLHNHPQETVRGKEVVLSFLDRGFWLADGWSPYLFNEAWLECVHQWVNNPIREVLRGSDDFYRCTQCGKRKNKGWEVHKFTGQDIYWKSFNKEEKMSELQKPSTKLEKQACKEAREEIIAEAVEKKKLVYKKHMNDFRYIEVKARSLRKESDELREKLGVTKPEMDQLFGDINEDK